MYLKNSQRLLVTEQVAVQPKQRFATMPMALYQRVKDGNLLHGADRCLVFGTRLEYFFTEHLSLGLEGGFDRVWSGQHLYSGWLGKFTIVPQVGAGREFFSRRMLLPFLVYGNWVEGLMGFVGGIPYQTRTYDLTTEHRPRPGRKIAQFRPAQLATVWRAFETESRRSIRFALLAILKQTPRCRVLISWRPSDKRVRGIEAQVRRTCRRGGLGIQKAVEAR